MNIRVLSPVRFTETHWRVLILALSGAVVAFTFWCLTHGITTIFMHLYYFPIVLLAYRYRWKGCGLAALLALSYFGLVLVFDTGQADIIHGAAYRVLVFVGIAAAIAFLSEHLAIETRIAQDAADLREQYISLAPAIVLVLDRKGTITYLNPKGGEILECIPEEVTGKSWFDWFLPEYDRNRVKRLFSMLVAGRIQPDQSFENPVLTRGGTEKTIRWHNTVLHGESGAFSGILSFGEDITNEKQTQDTLQKMQLFQESVIANANIWISVLAPDGSTILVWNDAAEAISGYKKRDVVGKKTVWKQLYPDNEYRRKVTGDIRRIIGKDEFLENYETEIRCADGNTKIIVWDTRGLRDDTGTITGYIAIGRDVTAQKSAEFRAGESSRFLAAMINSLPLPVFFKDTNGKYLGCNPPFEKYIGINPGGLTGKTVYDISPKDLADIYTAADRQLFDNPVPQQYETQVQYADGTRHDVMIYKSPFFNRDGTIAGLIGAFVDITDRKRAEEVLRESEEKFRLLFRYMSAGSALHEIVYDGSHNPVDYRILDVNPAFGRILGLKREDIIGKTSREAYRTDTPPFLDAYARVASTGEPEEFEVYFAPMKKHFAISVYSPGGGRFATIFEDITERKLAEEALQKSEEKFRIVADYTFDWEYWLAPDGTFAYMSPSCERITGYPAADFYQDPSLFSGIIHPDDKPAYDEHIDQSAASAVPESVEYRIVRKDGEIRWISHICQPMFGHHGELLGRRSSNRDDTERKQAEIALRENEEKYRAFFSTSRDCVFITMLDGTWVDFNNAAVDLFGYESREDLMKVKVSRLYTDPDERDAHISYIRKKGYSFEYPVDLKKKDGTIINTLITTVARKDASGNIIGFQGSIRDITAKKRTERQLLENQEQLATAMDMARLANWEFDITTGIFTFNDRFYAMYGTTAEREGGYQMPAKVYAREFVHPDDAGVVAAEVKKATESTDPLFTSQVEHRIIRRDGAIRYILVRHAVTKDAEGRTIKTHGANQDITERRLAEEEIRLSNVILKTQQETSPDGILVVDESGKILLFNRRFTEIWGIPEEVMESRIDERVLSFVLDILANPQEFLDRVRYLYEHREEMSREEIRLNDGRVVERYSAPMFGEKNRYFGRVWYFQDITGRKKAEEALYKSEEMYRLLADNVHDVIWTIGPNMRLTYISPSVMALRGLTPEEAMEEPLSDSMTPESYQKILKNFAHFSGMKLDGGAISGDMVMEIEFLRRDGSTIWTEMLVTPLHNRNGTMSGVVGVTRDISQRRRMEAELRESRQLFSDIISFLPDPTFVIDMDGKVLAWNLALEQLSGVPAEDIIGKGNYEYSLWQYGKRRPILADLVLQPDEDAGRLQYTGIRREGHTVTAQTEIITAGTEKKITLSLVASPLIDVRGNVTGAIESMRDITHIKETEAELARINENLEKIVQDRTRALEDEIAQRLRAEKDVRIALSYTRSVIEANPDLILVLDAKGTVLDVNATAELLTGIPREQMIGRSILTLDYVLDDSGLPDTFSRLLETGRLLHSVRVRRTDGHITPLSVNATMIKGEDGTDARIIVAGHDITRQKQDEEAIQASLDEKVVLLREVHHRVKNNLQIIISLVNLQMRQTGDPGVKQIMAETQNRVRAMSLVHEKLYRSESLSRIDFADYIRFLATQLFSFYGTDTRRVRLDLVMGKIMVDINTAVPLGLLMNELVSNALKHAFPNGREGTIGISGGEEGDLITLVVRDDGIGIPKDLDWKNTTTLGMRLVTSLIDQIDGTVALDRKNGTVFTLTVKRPPSTGGE